MISMILVITKAKVVSISRGKSKGFKLYWMGKYPSNCRKEQTLGKIKMFCFERMGCRKIWLNKLYVMNCSDIVRQ